MSLDEEWRPIPGYPHYEASSLGRVRSIDCIIEKMSRYGVIAPFKRKGQILVQSGPYSEKSPYYVVSLGKRKRTTVHFAVALAFHGLPPSDLHQVAHRDGIHTNNVPGNLRWALPGENIEDDAINIRAKYALHEIDRSKRRLLRSDVLEIRKACQINQESQIQLAERFGINAGWVNQIVARKAWKHV